MNGHMYCVHHGRRKVFSHNTEIGGVKLGVYVCPLERCETLPDFGAPDGADNPRDDDDQQAGELIAA
jgi:hypothetical protein